MRRVSIGSQPGIDEGQRDAAERLKGQDRGEDSRETSEHLTKLNRKLGPPRL